MKEEWRRFLLQWVLPAGIFAIAMIFIFASFSAGIKRDTASSYRDSLTAITKEYGTVMNNSVKSTLAVGQSVAQIIDTGGINQGAVTEGLDAITDNTDAYLVIAIDTGGDGITNSGDHVNMSELSYAEHIDNEWNVERFFVEDDEITGATAYVISMKLDTARYKRIFIYYPMTGANTRKYIPVETEHDSMGFAMLIDDEGTIYSSTGSNESLMVGKNLWSDVIANVNASTLTRTKAKLRSGTQGYLEGRINNRDYVINFAPVGNSDFYVIVNFTRSTVEKQEAKLFKASISKIGWCIGLIIVFILVVSAINIMRIFSISKNSKELSEKADTDQLTGMKNKIATEREIKDYIEKNPDSLGMLFLIDIDNFKKINDTMGHAFGDEVLRELGKNIGINFRVSDIIGRTGGDEFTIFLKNLKEDANCIREAQKLVYFFKHFQVGDYVKYSVTASIGAAVFPDHGADFETLYKSADAAVYKSKKRGKAQLSFFDDRDKTPEEVAEADAHHISLERHEE